MRLEDLKKKRVISGEVEVKVLKDTAFQFGGNLEEARTLRRKTQKELAKDMGSTQSVIARIENGDRSPSFPFMQRIADALDTYIIAPKFGFVEERNNISDIVSKWFVVDERKAKSRSVEIGEVKEIKQESLIITNYA